MIPPSAQLSIASGRITRAAFVWWFDIFVFHALTIMLAGRELGSYALEEYTSVKAVHWNFGEKVDFPF